MNNREPRYHVGQKVHVRHQHMGEWTGVITDRRNAGDVFEIAWEYEVSNAPVDNDEKFPESSPYPPGYRWFPLLWESEIVGLVS